MFTFGAGAIGTYIGGSLALAGSRLCFWNSPKWRKLRQRGLRLDLTLDKRRKMQDASGVDPSSFVIVSSLEEALRYGPFDVALFALKSFDTQAALEGMKPFADKMPPILCLSNGVSNEQAIAEALGNDKVIYGTVTLPLDAAARGYCAGEITRSWGCKRTSTFREIEPHLQCRVSQRSGCSHRRTAASLRYAALKVRFNFSESGCPFATPTPRNAPGRYRPRRAAQ